MAPRARLIGWLARASVLALACDDASAPAASGGEAEALTTPQTSAEAGTSRSELDASAETAPELTELLTRLVRAVDVNAASYGPVDRSDLEDLLSLALVHAESPGGRGAASTECASQAVANGFTDAQVGRLCNDVRYDSAGCAVRAAGAYGFDRDATVSLCAARGSTETADCAEAVFGALGFSRAQAVSVCAERDGADAARCVTSARGAGFDREQTVALCARRGGTGAVECANRASQGLGFSREEAVALCANRGALETATCAGTAVSSFGFSRRQAVDLCSNRGQPSIASCAGRMLVLGIPPAHAIEACRRPPTSLIP